MRKIDCFGRNNENHECEVLNETFCNREKCAFYKTEEQVKEEREKYDAIYRSRA